MFSSNLEHSHSKTASNKFHYISSSPEVVGIYFFKKSDTSWIFGIEGIAPFLVIERKAAELAKRRLLLTYVLISYASRQSITLVTLF